MAVCWKRAVVRCFSFLPFRRFLQKENKRRGWGLMAWWWLGKFCCPLFFPSSSDTSSHERGFNESLCKIYTEKRQMKQNNKVFCHWPIFLAPYNYFLCINDHLDTRTQSNQFTRGHDSTAQKVRPHNTPSRDFVSQSTSHQTIYPSTHLLSLVGWSRTNQPLLVSFRFVSPPLISLSFYHLYPLHLSFVCWLVS